MGDDQDCSPPAMPRDSLPRGAGCAQPAPGGLRHVRAGIDDPPQVAAGHPHRRVQSRDLLGSDTEVEIQHGAALYRLRLTSLGKLILTK